MGVYVTGRELSSKPSGLVESCSILMCDLVFEEWTECMGFSAYADVNLENVIVKESLIFLYL